MSEYSPNRQQRDLADVVEMLLDKGVVINADIAVSVGDTQLLGIQVRAAIASFDTAARYGLEFPEGTDMQRMAEAVDDPSIAEMDRPQPPVDPTRGVAVSAGDESEGADGEPIDVEETDAGGADGDGDGTPAENGTGDADGEAESNGEAAEATDDDATEGES